MINDKNGIIESVKQIETEYWCQSGKNWRRAGQQEADLVLYFKITTDLHGEGQISQFIDAIIEKPRTLVLIKST